MTPDATLAEAIAAHVGRRPLGERDESAKELNRFGRWFGMERPIREIQPYDLERYQEQLAQSGIDPRKLEPLRTFLSDARARKWVETSLAVHVRVRKKSALARVAAAGAEVPRLELTEEGFVTLQAELEQLEREVRPQIQAEMQRAAADGDFRENAPYHAAKERLSHIQTRINQIKASLSVAQIAHKRPVGQRIGVGSKVVVRELSDDEEVTYTLVGPGEINLRQGRISIQSPLGRALADRAVGDVVKVETPAGHHQYRIERIEAA